VLIHLVDVGAMLLEGRDPIADYDAIRHELAAYDAELLDRTELVALSKIDLIADRESLDAIEGALRERGLPVFRVSGATGEGVATLLQAAAAVLDASDRAAAGDAAAIRSAP
jgi:GTP-binding protein